MASGRRVGKRTEGGGPRALSTPMPLTRSESSAPRASRHSCMRRLKGIDAYESAVARSDEARKAPTPTYADAPSSVCIMYTISGSVSTEKDHCESSHVIASALPMRSASVAIRFVSLPVTAALDGPARRTEARKTAITRMARALLAVRDEW